MLYLNRVDYLVSQNTGEVFTDMKEVIEEVLQAVKVIRNDVEIISNLEEDIYFNGSHEPWRITIENLIDNALRYATDTVIITLKEDELSVANNGPQMSEDRIQSLFKPFEKGQGGQFGIGLSIVHKVVSANGYVVVGENTDDGVVFKIGYPQHKIKQIKKQKSRLSDETIKDAKFASKEK